jgi:hypothetical protein
LAVFKTFFFTKIICEFLISEQHVPLVAKSFFMYSPIRLRSHSFETECTCREVGMFRKRHLNQGRSCSRALHTASRITLVSVQFMDLRI